MRKENDNKVYCLNCKYARIYASTPEGDLDCNHKSNLIPSYPWLESNTQCYLKKPEKLNKNNKCKNYSSLSKSQRFLRNLGIAVLQ